MGRTSWKTLPHSLGGFVSGKTYDSVGILEAEELECYRCGRTVDTEPEEVKLPKGWKRNPDFPHRHPRDPHAFLWPSCAV